MAKSEPVILVPVDFSVHSEAALVWAARLAEVTAMRLLVLHVVHDPFSAPGYYFDALSAKADKGVAKAQKGMRRLRKVAGGLLRDFLDDVRARHAELGALAAMETELVRGLIAQRIIEVAEREHAGMIVMGSHGRTGLAHLMIGSRAERVVRLAPMPVVIVKDSGDTSGDADTAG